MQPDVSTPPRTTTGGHAWVSWLRTFAIVAVVVIHLTGNTAVSDPDRQTAVGQLAVTADFLARWAVPVFVMVSGALLLDPSRYRGPRDFLRRRALRLVPAVVVWHLVYLAYVVFLDGRETGLRVTLGQVMDGRLYTALYFFWIVLGLALVTPVLVPWVAQVSSRAVGLAGVGALSMMVLSVVTAPIRESGLIWVDTAWTWWIPYLGYYLIGYGLRDVVLRGPRLALTALVTVAGSALLVWQWARVDGLAGTIERYAPAEEYYGPVVAAVAISIFVLGRSTIRPGGLLDVLCSPTLARVGYRLGGVTLGVFAVHLLVRQAVLELPGIGGELVATSVGQLLARFAVVLVLSFALALAASRIPVVRRVF
ncbi:MAG: acyltransferase family protein [Nocardioidaceae bacterium]|nr:acyltransferase family protein [Nocardioidaceae bacterium]